MTAVTQIEVLNRRSKILVYFLAAPEEEDECQAIRKHLSPAIRNSKIPIEIRSDFEIPAGEDKALYKQKLLEADIVLALISSDYISDDETYARTQKVIERYNNNQTILVPILVRNCLWKSTPFVNLPLLPKNFQPLNNKQFWNSEDDALMAVVGDIYEAINKFSEEETSQRPSEVEINRVTEQKAAPAATFVDQERMTAQPEKMVTETFQQVLSASKNEDNSQSNKQKPVTPIEVDWRKNYYKKVLWKRLFAFLIDQILTWLPAILIGFVFAIVGSLIWDGISNVEVTNAEVTNSEMSDAELNYIILFAFIFYFIVCAKMESSKWRGTFGKRILKLQITDREGHPISFSRALVRNILRTLVGYSYLLLIPFIIQIFSFKKAKKLFHDQLSSTVIGERLNN